MTHRILVLGAGYAGAIAAGSLARCLRPSEARITLVNAAPDFVERVRLHERAVGRELRRRPLDAMFAGTPLDLRIARVDGLDVGARQVSLDDGTDLPYDSLVLGLGSSSAPVPGGAGALAHTVGDTASALRLRDDLSALPAGGRVSVVGAGLTGLELATEIAESRPDLRLTLHTARPLGTGLSTPAVRHLHRALARLGIALREDERVEGMDEESVHLEGGGHRPADLVAWSGGFVPSPLAAASALDTHADGRVLVDRSLRSLSHPEVLAVGDVARAEGNGGAPLRMSCASGMPMGWQAAETLVAELRGRRARRMTFAYVTQCISLGRRDGVIQPVHADDSPRRTALTGRAAALTKESVCRSAAWGAAHPTFGYSVPTGSSR